MAVDLDALAAELKPLHAILQDQSMPDALRVSSGMHGGWFCVYRDGSVTLTNTVTNSQISRTFLATLDIIRRHVSSEPSRHAAVDVDVLMEHVAEYGTHCRSQFDAMVKGNGDEEQRYNDLAAESFAAIRAMLEQLG